MHFRSATRAWYGQCSISSKPYDAAKKPALQMTQRIQYLNPVRKRHSLFHPRELTIWPAHTLNLHVANDKYNILRGWQTTNLMSYAVFHAHMILFTESQTGIIGKRPSLVCFARASSKTQCSVVLESSLQSDD